MNLYEIDYRMKQCINDDGEVDTEQLAGLEMQRNEKLENIAMWIKNLNAERDMLTKEMGSLQSRLNAKKKKADSLKKYLAQFLDGAKFETARVLCSFRKSRALEFDVPEEAYAEYLTEKKMFEYLTYESPKLNKKALTEAIKNGMTFDGCRIAEKNNIQIK